MALSEAPNILILYSSRYGQTEKIAQTVAELIKAKGLRAQALSVHFIADIQLKEYDGIIIGTPVYIQRTNKKLQRWVHQHLAELKHLKTALFTVSLNAGDSRPPARQADRQLLEQFQLHSGWHPRITASFIGALAYRKYNPLIRFLMKRISAEAGGPTDTSRNHELTDWMAVRNFVDHYLTSQFSLEKIQAASKNTDGFTSPRL